MAGAPAGGLCYLAGQVVSEQEVCSPATSPRGVAGSRRSLEEALTALRKGALLLKHGRHGKPKVHFFRLSACDTLLRWRGASGSVKQVRLRNVLEVVAGQTTDVFRRCPLRASARCFSLVYRDEDGSSRTLDLTCADEQQYELWLRGLKVVAERLRTLGTPVVGAAAASSGGATPPLARGPSGIPFGSGSGLGIAAAVGAAGGLPGAGAGAGGLSPAELARCVAGGRALQRTSSSGAVGIPVAERIPCDLLAWGAAQRAPPVAPSLRSVLGVQEECWQRRSSPGLAPGGGHLDAYRAGVGRKHGAVVTATGALYTWGEGRGGKLGLGHDQDQQQPQRVRHGLEGQCVVAAACGDDCTAALTDAGELFMWGRLHADAPPQLVPLHVRGELRGRKVVQISCGPFHCAAITSDGALFTWGEGFGGKLGHGDQGNRAHPALVAAFAGRQVLHVACGVWHTAAVVAEPEGSNPFHLLALQHSPLRAEGSGAGGGGGGSLTEGNSLLSVTSAGGEAAAAAAAALAAAGGLPPASPVHHGGASHHRNNSTSSAFSEVSAFCDGQGGSLYTWGGVNESVAFGSSEKHDSNKGCLGHGEADLYRGQLLPVRVGGALDCRQVRHVAAGSHLTVAVTTGGRVYQMGATGASGSSKHCPWEGATSPELVRGPLQGFFIDEVSCGMHHVLALGRPADRKTGRPADHAPRAVFAWGRGSEGQLGGKGFEDSPAPVLVDGLKGRHVLQVTCGGSNSMAVCEHNVGRWEPDSKEEAEAASRALYALTAEATKPPSGKQLRIQAPGEEPGGGGLVGRRDSERSFSGFSFGGKGGIVRRSLSVIVPRSSGGSVAGAGAAAGALAGGHSSQGGSLAGGPPNLQRDSVGSVRSMGAGSAAGSVRGGAPPAPPSVGPLVYSLSGGSYRSQPSLGQPSLGRPSALQRLRSDRTGSGGLGSASESGYDRIGSGQRMVNLGSLSPVKGAPGGALQSHGSFGRRNTYAGGGVPPGAGMASARSFTALSGGGGGAASYGRASDRSSLSSWHHNRAHSDDGRAHDNEVDSAGAGLLANGSGALGATGTTAVGHRTLSNSSLGGGGGGLLDEVRFGSSVAYLQDELAEKNRIIDRLQRKLEKMQAAAQRGGSGGGAAGAAGGAAGGAGGREADAEQRLREAVQASAGAFRAAQSASTPQRAQQQQQRPATSPAAGGSRRGEPPRPGSSQGASPSGSMPMPGGASTPGSPAASLQDQQAELSALRQLLAKKEAHLEGQQQKLAAWASELQRREQRLAAQKSRLELRGPSFASSRGSGGGSGRLLAGSPNPAPEPIPSESPVLPGRAGSGPLAGSGSGQLPAPAGAAPAVSPLVRRAIGDAPAGGATTPSSNGSTPLGPAAGGVGSGELGSGAGTPGTPALPGEWQEEFEEGVHLTFTSEGGVTKLKRIRFSRSLFSADSAKQWYESNKHLLAQPTGGTPRLAGLTPAASNGNGGGSSLGSASQPGTPLALPAGQQQLGEPQEARPQAQEQQREEAAAAQGAPQAGPKQEQQQAGTAAAVRAGLLHYRQTSRNLSFDARELATFHERLQAAASEKQPQSPQAAASVPPGLPPAHRPPSRLAQMSKQSNGAAAAGSAAGSDAGAPESPFAAATRQQQDVQHAAERGRQTSLSASPVGAPGLEGEGSRPYLSAQSSPLLGPQQQQGGEAPTPARDLLVSHCVPLLTSPSSSSVSSPIKASGGSRSSSPLGKQRSGLGGAAAAASLAKQPSRELGKAAGGGLAQQQLFTPRDAAAHSRSNSSFQGSPAVEASAGGAAAAAGAAGGRPGSSSPSSSGGSALSRLRRSLTGGLGSKK